MGNACVRKRRARISSLLFEKFQPGEGLEVGVACFDLRAKSMRVKMKTVQRTFVVDRQCTLASSMPKFATIITVILKFLIFEIYPHIWFWMAV